MMASPTCLAFLQRGDGFMKLNDSPSVLSVKTLHEAPVQNGTSLSPSGGLLMRLRGKAYAFQYSFLGSSACGYSGRGQGRD